MAEVLLIGDPEIVQDWRDALPDHRCSVLTLQEMSELASHAFHRNGGSYPAKPPIPDIVLEAFGSLEDKMTAADFLPEFIDDNTTVVTNVIPASATEVAEWLDDYPRVIGVCLLPSMLKLVPRIEACRPPNTVDAAATAFQQFAQDAGKGVEWVDDRVGLVTPRILSMVVNEAAFAVMEGVAEPADIDRAMRLGANYPKGPLAWGDEIGLDYIVMTLEALFEEYHDERYRPCVMLKQMVRAGKLGRREGAGFFSYII